MITLKDYAKKQNVSYEAIRKQVNRYRDELGEYLYKQGKTQYLTEEGEKFLDERRKENPVVVLEQDRNDRITELEEQNEQLKTRILQLQEQLIQRDKKVIELQDELLLLSAPAEPPKEEPELEPNEAKDALEEKKPRWWQFWK